MTRQFITRAAQYFLAIAFFVPGVALADEAGDLTGRWKGSIDIPGTKLDITIDFEQGDEGWTGDISIPLQHAKDLPLADIKIEGTSVSFTMPGIPGDPSFSGTLSEEGDELAGDFSQSGRTFPFTLARGSGLADSAAAHLVGFDAFIEQAVKDWMVPGLAIGIVAEDEVVYAKAFGLRDVEKKLPATTKTLYAIGSCTKAFTTFAMGTLVDEGKLNWDDPVINYLPGFKLQDDYATTHLTPRDMVTHRSGLPRHDLVWYNNTDTPRAEFVRRLQYLQPSEELRAKFQYNNLMFLTAGYLVGQLTGGTWEEAVRARIFDPLGMTSANFSVEKSQQADDFALPYKEKDDELKKVAFRNITNVGPAGSINACVDDMTKWVKVHLNNGRAGGKQIIEESTLRELHTPQVAIPAMPSSGEVSPVSYAMGWMTDTYRGHYRVHHGGGIDGFTAQVAIYPFDGLGVVVLVNKSGAALASLLVRHATDRILDLEPEDWNADALEKRSLAKDAQKEAEEKKDSVRKPGTKPAHPLEAYAGRYKHPGYGVVQIDPSGDGLRMVYNNISTPFEHWHYETFNGLENPEDDAFEDFKITFRTDSKGNVSRLEAQFDATVDPIRFDRMPDSRMTDPAYLERFTGDYEMAGQKVVISLKGNALTLFTPGQPVYELVADQNDEFDFKDIAGFSVRFTTDENGEVTPFVHQPNGVFELKRADAD